LPTESRSSFGGGPSSGTPAYTFSIATRCDSFALAKIREVRFRAAGVHHVPRFDPQKQAGELQQLMRLADELVVGPRVNRAVGRAPPKICLIRRRARVGMERLRREWRCGTLP